MNSKHSIRLIGVFCSVVVLNPPVLADEELRFAVVDEIGQQRHISIIPKAGYDQDGNVRDSHNPNSIVYQHARMLKALQTENLEINRQAALSYATDNETLPEQSENNGNDTPGNIFLRK